MLNSEYKTTKIQTYSQPSHYLLASILGTAVHYLILHGLVQFFLLNTVIASTCGGIAGAVTIYVLNYYVVFKSNQRHRETILRFFLVACLGLVLNGTILKILTFISTEHYLILQMITTTIVFGVNYAINRNWTFSSEST